MLVLFLFSQQISENYGIPDFTFKWLTFPACPHEILAYGVGCYMALETQINVVLLDTFVSILNPYRCSALSNHGAQWTVGIILEEGL